MSPTPSSTWSRLRNVLAIGGGSLASFFLTLYLLRWAAGLDRHYNVDWGGPVEIRTHAGLFLKMGLLGSLPAFVGGIVAAGVSRWIAVAVGLGCILVACICEGVVQYLPQPWFTF
ncbi:hypothetical protein I6A60_29005 [Frankia sp. AgB1.9]|uniref:hypothetical protein n=1 Tax=unclassified Frankia TaxID=2632575 RepID=UPI001933A54E|nr:MULTISPECIES: hypothetical protein [unclassified Frankia]MBL7492319.1 hypothetical protein [Frankia sp. AgW1.1]MBL7551869.1 hypothetical protein [Frankia sp. AgB1.9]MBL7625551.1 hypothetical protein [Frankia sp. AgB1.8]